MAHVEKFTKAAAGHMFKHYERAQNEQGAYVKFANQSIDLSRTNLNYNLAPDRKMSQGDFVKKRCTEDGIRCMNRKDVNVMCSWIVTAPQNLREENHDRFFDEVYNFLSKRYGVENVVSAYVHLDETQPHIHFAFVPVVKDKKRGSYKVSAKELIDKRELLKFHPDLSNHMITAFGYDIGIENGATALGNQTVEQLKAGEELKKDLNNKIETLNQQVEFSAGHVEFLDKEIDEKSAVVEKLEDKQSALEATIQSDKSELDKIAKKKIDIKAVENIEVKHTLFGDKATVSSDDFDKLQATAKKQIVYEKTNKKLKSDVAELKQENQKLSEVVEDLNRKCGKTIKLTLENAELKKKISFLQNRLAQVLEFVEKLGLKERLEAFWNPPIKQREHEHKNKLRGEELL